MKYEEKLSKDILSAVQKVKDKFDTLCQQQDYLYLRLCQGNKGELINNKSGIFSEVVHCEMGDEVTELIRAILLKKDWFESNPYEYLYPMNGQNKPSEDEINFIKQRNEELKKFYNIIGDECNTAATFNLNKKG